MKTINPFKRLNKEDFIPCSLFPASKVCDTSLDIGRATPLYCLDMVAGNRVSLDVSQLTRFQPMLAPVMTNYSVEFGAFFVPYVALDEFFTSTWFRTNCQNTDIQRRSVLRAREFFNPAIDNSEKVHPWMFSTQRCGKNVKWVGSLYDHLRAPLGLPDWSVDSFYSSASSSQPSESDQDVVDAWLNSKIRHGIGNSISETSITFSELFSAKIYDSNKLVGSSGKFIMSPIQFAARHPDLVPSLSTAAASLRPLSTIFTAEGDVNGDRFVMSSLFENDTPYAIGNFWERGNHTRSGYIFTSINSASFGTAVISSGVGSPASWSISFASASEANTFISAYYTYVTGKVANGTFSISNSLITYVAGSSSSEGSLGKSALSNLFELLIYSQMMPFVDHESTDVPLIATKSDGSGEFIGFPLWIAKHYGLLDGNSVFESIIDSESPAVSLAAFFTLWKTGFGLTAEHKYFARVMSSILLYFYGASVDDWTHGFVDADVIPYSDLFGKNTIVQVQNAYRSYVESLWISANRNLQWNSVYWLCYHRIFADWFLNEHYTKHEDYLDLVGSAYIAGAQSLSNGDGKTMDDWFKPGQLSNGNNPKLSVDPTLSYFADRISRGECMPVLWSLDSVTNLRQSTSTSSTPIGQSITENFYNRFYARFKDLINRMGPDYRRNARALYGKGPDDASLLRSQVVGYRSFDVQVGDVAQNSESTKDSVLGQFAGYAVSRDRAGSFDWTAQESGVFIVLAWVRPKYTCFSDLVPRSLYKSEYMDYLIPQFGGVGYQDFAFKQLNPTDKNGDSRLGFEERYSEYMMMDNECSGLMRTSMAYYNSNRIGTPCYTPGSADFYHLLYMDEESDLKRVFVDNFNDPVLISAYFNGNVTRQLPATIKTEF